MPYLNKNFFPGLQCECNLSKFENMAVIVFLHFFVSSEGTFYVIADCI